jgi:phospholipid/cholesterol/gamma-HCH transport system ATP-binding protein
MDDSLTIIRFSDVSRAFDGVAVLKSVSAAIPRGAVTFVVGPSGCGKSVLMKMIVGMERPDSGTVTVDGTDVSSLDRRGLGGLRRRIAFVPQHPALFDSIDVAANVALPLTYHGVCGRDEAVVTAGRLLDRFGLGHRLHSMPSALNASDRKIVSIIRSMALEPECLILDEPTTGLDAPARHAVDAMIADIGRDNRQSGTGRGFDDVRGAIETGTLVVISHDMKATMSIADRIVFLYNGGIRLEGTPDDFAAAAGMTGRSPHSGMSGAAPDPVVAQFLSGAADGPMTSRE